MPPFISSSWAVGGLIRRVHGVKNMIRCANNNSWECRKIDQVSQFSRIPSIETNPVRRLVPSRSNDEVEFSFGKLNNGNTIQRRQFLCFKEVDSVLSKVYEENRVLGYSPEQLYDVVAAVDLYHGFVPWCQRSDILKHYPNGSFDAELEIGFKFLVESYVSHVELDRPKCVKTTVSNSNLFDHLINIWEFSPGPAQGTCNIHFLVDFKFNSPLYRQVASVFFREVVSRLVGAFSERCRVIYGPGVPIRDSSYKQRT